MENVDRYEAARQARNEYMREYKKNMTAEQKQARKDYNKKWHEQNPEKQREYQANYWLRKAEEMKQQRKI